MKQLITSYSFDAANKKVTFLDLLFVEQSRILLITNVTTNAIVYNFADSTKGGTTAANVLTLTYNTASMSNSDSLQIYYDMDQETETTDYSFQFNTIIQLLTEINIKLS
jgi:hypothetical protein